MDIALLIAGLTQVAKMSGLPSKFLPAFAVVLGAGLGYVSTWTFYGATNGVMAGLVTTGLVNRLDAVATKAGGIDTSESEV